MLKCLRGEAKLLIRHSLFFSPIRLFSGPSKIPNSPNTQKPSNNNPLQQNSISIGDNMQKKDQNKISVGVADLAAGIIRRILTSPNLKELERMSLRHQLIKMIDEAEVEPDEKDAFYELFRDGIPYNSSEIITFNQLRIKDAVKIKNFSYFNKLLVFNPISSVTSQVFSSVIFVDYDYLMSYGHFGISKTFGYYAIKKICDIIIKLRIQTKQSDKEIGIKEQNKQYFERAPKIFYMTINDDTKISVFQQQLKRSFLQQCPQIPKSLLEQDKDFISLLKKIVLYYEKKYIRVFLVVDQINIVASAFRDKYIKQKNNIAIDDKTSQRYKKVAYFNQLRLEIIANVDFSRIIYNSSVNNQAILSSSNLNQQQNKKLMGNIKENLRLFPQFKHNRTKKVMQQRVLYPQIAHFDSSIWSLADCFLFEVENSAPKTQIVKIDRRVVFQAFKQLTKKITITPLIIRQAVQQFVFGKQQNQQKKFSDIKPLKKIEKKEITQQNFLEVLKIIQKSTKERVNSSLQKLMEKLVDNKERQQATMALFLKTEIALSNQKLIQIKKQEQQDHQQDSFTYTMRQRIDNLFSPLETNSFCITQKEHKFQNIFANIDRHLFIYFEKEGKLKSYLLQFQWRAIRELVSQCHSDQQIEQLGEMLGTKVQQLHQLLMQKGKVVQPQEPGLSLVISFLPFAEIKAILEPRILSIMTSQLWMYKDQMRKMISDNNSAYGSFLEKYLINSLKQQKGLLKVQYSNNDGQRTLEINIQKEQTFISLTRKLQIKSKKNQRVQKANNNQFLDQFVEKALADSKINRLIFTPVTLQGKHNNNSKAIDFVIVQRKSNVLFIQFFDVAVSLNQTQIQNKIKKFIECFSEFYKDFQQATLFFDYFIVSGAHNFQVAKKAVYKQGQIMSKIKKQSQEQILSLLGQLFAQYQTKVSKHQKGQIQHRQKLLNQIIGHFDACLVSENKPNSQEVGKMLRQQKDLGQDNLKQFKEEIMELVRKRKHAYDNLQKIAIINSKDFKFSGESGSNKNQTFFAAIRQAAVQQANQESNTTTGDDSKTGKK